MLSDKEPNVSLDLVTRFYMSDVSRRYTTPVNVMDLEARLQREFTSPEFVPPKRGTIQETAALGKLNFLYEVERFVTVMDDMSRDVFVPQYNREAMPELLATELLLYPGMQQSARRAAMDKIAVQRNTQAKNP